MLVFTSKRRDANEDSRKVLRAFKPLGDVFALLGTKPRQRERHRAGHALKIPVSLLSLVPRNVRRRFGTAVKYVADRCW